MKKIGLFYTVVRITIGVMFILNVIGIFLLDNDSQQSRLVFNAVQSLLLLIVTILPGLIERKFKLNIPDFMEVIFIIMCIFHFILGEIGEFYIHVKWWDSMLHTLSGSMIAILGYSLANSIDQDHNQNKLTPFFVSLFAVCFSVTIGVVWEVAEFLVDAFVGTNMQRYLISDTLEPLVGRAALVDTMKDLILDTLGAIVIAIIGFIDMKNGREAFKNWILRREPESLESKSYIPDAKAS
ncbi:hypothetical protein [Haloplasma contractile]|uniref:Membrane-spanning protein n=1 Tax=Haloplasma contractile SSD-17B TaxID=1033810 RepID=F7PU50_9MOLU|nr:hypothetical protein [Haloplasma contractile]ERJ11772.1 Membrane-spanning protein [Haloplasma contractile SSD-17B]